MNIDYAIVSSDDNPLYLDFWPIISKLWKVRLGITPVLLYFGSGNPTEQYGQVVRMPKSNTAPLYLQCTCSRLWYPGTLKDKVSIISDIDMLPLSKWYFKEQHKDIPNNHYIHLNPCIESYGQLAMCYNIASGDTFNELLHIPTDWEEAMKHFVSEPPIRAHTAEHPLWFVDESILTRRILGRKDVRIHLMPRPGGQDGNRINRHRFTFDRNLLKQERYFDCHSARPLSQHRNAILTIAGEL